MRRRWLYFCDSVCGILKKALLTTGEKTSTYWTDKIAGNNIDFVKSNAFKFNGTDNYIDTGVMQEGGIPISLNFSLITTGIGTTQSICFNGSYVSVAKGFRLNINNTTGVLELEISDGSTRANYPLGLSLTNNIFANISLSWNGQIGGICNLKVNDLETNTVINHSWTGNSALSYRIGRSASAYSFKGWIAKSVMNNIDIPFQTGQGNEVWNVNSLTEDKYTILGTVNATNHVLQDEYHYNVDNGFTWDSVNSRYIPASQLNAGFDVQGNALTNPAIPLGHNGAETLIKAKYVAEHETADTLHILFDGAGNSKEVDITTIGSNNGNYLFLKIIEDGKRYENLTLFESPRTEEEMNKIIDCYSESTILPNSKCYVVEDGEKIPDYTNMGYVIEDCN